MAERSGNLASSINSEGSLSAARTDDLRVVVHVRKMAGICLWFLVALYQRKSPLQALI